MHPPVLGREAPSTTAARWRFRVLTGVLLAIIGVFVFVLFLKVAGITDEDPGFGVGLSPARTPSVSVVPAAR